MAKTVFITGASSGFGKATAKLFLAKGWNVIATLRSPEKETELSSSDTVLVVKLDVTDKQSIREAVSAGIEKFGGIDVLVNNAGHALIGVFESATEEQIQRQFAVNVFGLMNVTQAILPFMRKNKKGTIINLSSYGGLVALPTGSLYNSSKFAVEGFSESLAHELTRLNISVKLIEPGGIATNFRNNIDLIKNEISDYDALTSTFWEHHAKLTVHIKKASAEDVAETIFTAATRDEKKLRYVVGEDAQFFIDRKFKKSELDYMQEMQAYFAG